ncbi:hypothetical protein [Nocardioides caricicola]|uniref:Uncharacterized protein n=1 Tax=Nocardioides caricicola TaxID=634770 RepID=A0ABW0N3T4_9ACTN
MNVRRQRFFFLVPIVISLGMVAGAAISYAVDSGPEPLTANEV